MAAKIRLHVVTARHSVWMPSSQSKSLKYWLMSSRSLNLPDCDVLPISLFHRLDFILRKQSNELRHAENIRSEMRRNCCAIE